MCKTKRVAECGSGSVQGSSPTVSTVQKAKLIEYYHRRRDALDFCGSRSRHAIEDDKAEIMDLMNKDQRVADDPETQRALGNLTGPIACTSRNSLVIAVCCFLEDLLRRVGNLAIVGYDSEFKKDKNKHHDNFLKTHLRVLNTMAGIDCEPVKSQLVLLDYAILIRNSLVHAWGKIETSTNPDRLREALNAVDWAVESADGYVALCDQAYPEVMTAAVRLVTHVLKQLLPSE